MLDSLEARLRNWGRHFRNRFHKGHCYSLEGRYRSPQEWGDWENGLPLPSPMPSVDVLDACLIEDAWRSMDNRQLKKLLALYYVYRRSPKRIRIAVRLSGDFHESMMMAHGSILRFIYQSSENANHSSSMTAYFKHRSIAPVSVYA